VECVRLIWVEGFQVPNEEVRCSRCLSRTGAEHANLHLKDGKTRPRSPARTTGTGRCKDTLEARATFPKRQRHWCPEPRSSLPFPMLSRVSRVFNHMQALEVALDELRAPGGAFLPVPARGTQLTASQRAWLSWQLAHTGASLHWALATVQAMLAAQPWPQPASWPFSGHSPHAPRDNRDADSPCTRGWPGDPPMWRGPATVQHQAVLHPRTMDPCQQKTT
jgi:hypothetical protein